MQRGAERLLPGTPLSSRPAAPAPKRGTSRRKVRRRLRNARPVRRLLPSAASPATARCPPGPVRRGGPAQVKARGGQARSPLAAREHAQSGGGGEEEQVSGLGMEVGAHLRKRGRRWLGEGTGGWGQALFPAGC